MSRELPVEGTACPDCGLLHDRLPMSFHALAPAAWSPEHEGADGCHLDEEVCVINDEHHFIRGLVRIPIRGSDECFEWGVWVSLSKHNFELTGQLWNSEGREDAEPMFGWLTTELGDYTESTINLRTLVHTQPVGLRPLIELEPTMHPLALEQRDGISHADVVERVMRLMGR